MLKTRDGFALISSGSSLQRALLALVCLTATGCSLTPLARHTVAFSAATNLIVDNSTNAYRAAETLHDDAQGYQAVAQFDKPGYSPYKITPLISEDGLSARFALLQGVKTYAQNLSDLTAGGSSKDMDAASASVGDGLTKIGAALTADGSKFTFSQTDANLASTAAKGLALFFTRKIVKSEVPKQIKDMDPTIEALCTALKGDIVILRSQSAADYKIMIDDQDSFIRHNTALTPLERRDLILVLPQLVRRQRATDTLLAQLSSAIDDFSLTHHALAAAAQNNNPESLKARISELTAVGQQLATFYQSLPTS